MARPVYLTFLWLCATQAALTPDTRVRIGEFLFKDYSTKFLPMKSHRSMKIFMSAELYQLLEVNAKNQYLLVSVWMTQSWTDDYLFWDPSDFDGKNRLHVPAEDVWKPDTYLQNNIEMDPANSERPMTVVLRPEMASGPDDHNTTWVTMQFPAIYKISCPMNVEYFPWDEHSCVMQFTSWSFDQSQLDYGIQNNDSAGNSSYIRNQEYTLIKFGAHTDVHCYNDENPIKGVVKRCYSYANFTLEIKRKPLFYIFNLVIPSFVLTIICFMGLFSLSSSTGERTEKVSLGITTMLALSIILLVIGDQMPKTSVLIPIIGWYFLILMLLIALALVATVFVVHLHKRSQIADAVPMWLALISCKCGRSASMTKRSVTPANPQKINNEFANNIDHGQSKSARKPDDRSAPSDNEEIFGQIYQELVSVGQMLQNAAQKVEEREKRESKLEEWETAISALEKILFLLFSIFACIATGIFMLIGSSY